MQRKFLIISVGLFIIFSRKIACSTKLQIEEKGDMILIKTPSKTVAINDFMCMQLYENLDKEAVMPVLEFFEKWLNSKDYPEFAFHRVLKLYDPTMKLEDQGDSDDTFRIKCFVTLSNLAIEFKLEKTLIALTHPVNIPRHTEMCEAILAASHCAINFETVENYSEYVKLLDDLKCFSNPDNAFKKLSLKIIELLYEYSHQIFHDLEQLTFSFLKANELEKLKFLIKKIPDNEHLKPKHAIVDACCYGSYNLLDLILESCKEISESTKKECANYSSNKKTLQWVYDKFGKLPDNKSIKASCYTGNLDIIECVHSIDQTLLKSQEYFEGAVENEQLDLVKWFLDNFLDFLNVEKIIDSDIPSQFLEILESKSKITHNIFTSDRLLKAIKIYDTAFLKYAWKYNPSAVKELQNEANCFESIIGLVISCGNFETLKVLYDFLQFSITPFLKKAIEYGNICALRWIIQKLEGAQEIILDKELIEYLHQNQHLFQSITFDEVTFYNILKSGSLIILEYFVQICPSLKPRKMLKFAVENGSLDLVKFLFNPEDLLYLPYFSVLTALSNGQFEVVEWILKSKEITDKDWITKVKNYLLENMVDKGIRGSQIKKIKRIMEANE